jgi:hypothetical protein
MGTVLQMLEHAALLAGMRASGETMDAFLTQDCLTVLNQLIDAWALEDLVVYTMDRTVVPLQPGKQTYSVGPGGDISMVRPVRISDVNWRDESVHPALELPIRQMPRQEYHSLTIREMASTMPLRFYYEPALPLGTLFLWPVPSGGKMVVWTWHPWLGNYILSQPLTFPPGYERFLVHNLAVDLGQQPGARLTPQTVKIAEESKALVVSINVEAPLLGMPSIFRNWYHERYNYLTDNA